MKTPLLALTAAALLSPVLVPSAAAAPAVAVRTGATPETAVVPNDRFTVADRAQATGRRVALPVPDCTPATRSRCDALRLLNTLDGFDLQPRVFIPFTGDIDAATVLPSTVWIEGPGGRVGLQQLTFDPASDTLAATAREQLAERTRYTLVITRGVEDTAGRPIEAAVRVPFTTMSGTTELDRMRRSLDSGAAYRAAGIADRGLDFTQSGTTTVFPPTAAELITRRDQRSADPDAPLTSSQVPNTAVAGVGCYAFGSLQTPRFARPDATITPTATTRTPPVVGKERIGFALIVPAGVPPEGGWPTAVYGPGFTRSYFDLFVTADANAAAGIATIATDPIGHGYGPRSRISVGLPGRETTFLAYGRGRDLDGDGSIEDSEGSQPTKRVTLSGGEVVAERPSPNALHGLRGGLEQTVVDNMALLRAVQRGPAVPDCTGSPGARLAQTGTSYYGLSFGGIYGTMLMGTDPRPRRGLLNVAGGPITDIARLSGFRPRLADQLRVSRPNLLNGGPGRDGFTESIPDPLDPPITRPVPGAMEVQRYLAAATWYGRPGGPETYAPAAAQESAQRRQAGAVPGGVRRPHGPEHHQRQHHPRRRPVRHGDLLPQRPDADGRPQPARVPRRPDDHRARAGAGAADDVPRDGGAGRPGRARHGLPDADREPQTTCSACTTRTRRPVRAPSARTAGRPPPASAGGGRRARAEGWAGRSGSARPARPARSRPPGPTRAPG